MIPDGRIWIVCGLNRENISVRDTWYIHGSTHDLMPGPALPVEGGVAGAGAFRAGDNAIIVGGETYSGSNRSPCTSAFMYESKTKRLWRLPDVPAIPAAPGATAGTSSRRLWFLNESGKIAAEGGYRFVSPEEAAATGDKAGVHLAGERITLTIGKLPTLRD